MRVVVDSKALQAALTLVGRAVKKSTLPVLDNVLVRTNGEGLEVAATDLTVWIRCHVTGQIQEAGEVTLPQKRLLEFVGVLGKTSLTIAISGTKATLTAGGGKATITGIEAEEFPRMPEVDGVALHIRGCDLHTAFSRVLSAAAPDDSRPVLAGCLVRMLEGKLEMVTADGFRLARTEVPIIAGDLDKPFEVIVPARALSEAKSMLPSKGDEEVTLRIGLDSSALPTVFELETEQTKFASKLIEGAFPDFNRIVPREFKATATVSSDDLERATKSIKAVLGAKEPITRLKLKQALDDGAMGEIIVWGEDAENGQSEFTLPAMVELAVPGNGPVTVAFNGKYLTEALTAIDAKQVTLGSNGAAAPGLLRAPGVSGLDSYVVVMPMHVAK